MTLEGEPKRRATTESVCLKRSALVVVAVLHPKIARAQRRAAFLLQLARSGRPDVDGVLAAEVEALQMAVSAYFTSTKEEIEKLPDKVKGNSRIEDTLKALRSVHSVLDQARVGFARQ